MAEDIKLESVVSSNIAGIGFDEKTGTLRVQFNNGGLYETTGASQADFDEFKMSKSKGVHFNKVLKSAKTLSWSKVTKKG